MARPPPRSPFPPVESADGDGIVVWGVPVTVDNLLAAYRAGIFPWPVGEGLPVPWASPDPRAILDFSRLHVPRSLRQARRRRAGAWRFTIDADFPAVIAACSRQPRPGQAGTWITREVIAGYTELHRRGHAHSVEVWEGEVLIGGLYGVDSGGFFTGESMFYERPNASKLALLHLVAHLAARGADWLDIQQITPHLQALGAHEIRRRRFVARLEATLAERRELFPRPD